MCLTRGGSLNFSSMSMPPKPFALVANGRLCQAPKFSIIVQVCHCGVKPHLAPDATTFLAISPSSGQVVGGFSGSRPAFLNSSLFQ